MSEAKLLMPEALEEIRRRSNDDSEDTMYAAPSDRSDLIAHIDALTSELAAANAENERLTRELGEATKKFAVLEKQLAELRGGDGDEELAKRGYYAYQDHLVEVYKHDPNIPLWESRPESNRTSDIAAVRAVAAPHRLRIAELERELAQARKFHTNEHNDRVAAETVGNRLSAELALAEEACGQLSDLVDLYAETGSHVLEAAGRQAGELESTKQALADARAAITDEDWRYVSLQKGIAHLCEADDGAITANARLWRQWAQHRRPAIDAICAAPAQPAHCPNCTSEDIEHLEAKPWMRRCRMCKQRWSVPHDAKGNLVAPADHSGEANKKVEATPERRFVCPRCGNTRTSCGPKAKAVYCSSLDCVWEGTWAEVEAAAREGRQAVAGSAKSYDEIVRDKHAIGERLSEVKKQLAAERQAREAERQNLKATAELLGIVSAEAKELSQRAEAAEAATEVMREALTLAEAHVGWGDCSLENVHTICRKALATAPGRAANELRAYKKLAERLRPMIPGGYGSDKIHKEAFAELDQALAGQSEQGGGR